jgi:hypothetical protein
MLAWAGYRWGKRTPPLTVITRSPCDETIHSLSTDGRSYERPMEPRTAALIGVGKAFAPPLGFPASGSPVDSFLIGTVSLAASLCQAGSERQIFT